MQPKQVAQIDADIAAWTPTPTATPFPQPTETPEPIVKSYTPARHNEARWIDVNLTTQIMTAYEYDVPVYWDYASSGLTNTPTVTGEFRIYHRLPSQNMSGYHLGFDYYIPNVPWVMYFHGDYAFHGAYWHNNFGTPMSHGCVNLSVPTSEWLYDFADIGTLVDVHY